MTPEIHAQLRQRVESVVRPLWAFHWRKDRIREELLQHLIDIYSQEHAGGDELAAIHRSFERLGQIDQLTAELQASVPRSEQLLCVPLPLVTRSRDWFRAHLSEPLERLTPTRYFLCTVALSAVYMLAVGLPAFALVYLVGPPRRWPMSFSVFGTICLLFGTICLGWAALALLGRTARNLIDNRDRTGNITWPLTLIGCATGLVTSAITAGLTLGIGGDLNLLRQHFDQIAVASCVAPFVLLLIARSWAKEARRYREWESIDLV